MSTVEQTRIMRPLRAIAERLPRLVLRRRTEEVKDSFIEQNRPTAEITERSSEAMGKIENLFGTRHPVIGAVHFLPMLGYGNFTVDEVYERAKQDLQALEQGGADGVIFENNYDVPHKISVEPETVAEMTMLITRLRQDTKLPIGVSVLWNDYKAALSIAKMSGAEFVRVPVFVDDVRTNYGDVTGNPEAVTKYREQIGAENVLLFTDIHVKHSQVLNADTIEASAKKAITAGSDGLIVTGKWTGDAPDMNDLQRVRENVGEFPIILGSGVSDENVASLFRLADGAIVSTSLKEGDNDTQEVNIKPYTRRISEERVKRLIEATGRYECLPPEVLFICEGNVGRSQMAEAYFNTQSGSTGAISAGVQNVAQKYHGHPTQEIVTVMEEDGIDVSLQRVKQLRPQMLERAKSIVVFIEEGKLPHYAEQYKDKMTFILIDDPFGVGADETRNIRDQIKEIVYETISKKGGEQ